MTGITLSRVSFKSGRRFDPLVESLFRHVTHAMTRPLPDKLLHVCLLKPSPAIIFACSGQITMIASGPEGPSIRRAKLVSMPSPLVLSRSDARTELSALIAVTVLVSAAKPRSTCNGFPRARFFVFRNAETVFARPT